MVRFREVDTYPAYGFPDRMWGPAPESPGSPLHDAVLRAARPVVALYSEALDRLDLHGPRAGLRLSLVDPLADDESDPVRVSVWARHRDLVPETAFVTLSPAVGRLTAPGRARLLLDVVDSAVRTLAGVRGWDLGELAQCREYVVAHDYVYTWDGPWKSSPDRRHQARATYRLDEPDGFGRVRLEVRRRGEDGADLTSPPAVASGLSSRLRKSASTLAWSGSSSVGLTPLVGHGPGGGAVTAQLDGGSWTAVVRDDVTPRRPGVGIQEDPDAPVPTVVGSLI